MYAVVTHRPFDKSSLRRRSTVVHQCPISGVLNRRQPFCHTATWAHHHRANLRHRRVASPARRRSSPRACVPSRGGARRGTPRASRAVRRGTADGVMQCRRPGLQGHRPARRTARHRRPGLAHAAAAGSAIVRPVGRPAGVDRRQQPSSARTRCVLVGHHLLQPDADAPSGPRVVGARQARHRHRHRWTEPGRHQGSNHFGRNRFRH